jgi:O-antigen ligase
MQLVLLIWCVVGLVWGALAYARTSIALRAAAVILTGAVLGYPFFHANVGPIPVTLDRVLWGVVMAELAFGLASGRLRLRPLTRLDVLLIGWAILLTASTLAADWRYKEYLPLSRLLFFNWIPLGLYFVGRMAPLDARQARWLVGLAIGLGSYLAIVGIAETQGWTGLVVPRFMLDPQYAEFLGRARGPLLNPVSFGIFVIVCAVTAALVWRRARPVERAAITLAILMMMVATALTMTRSVWLAAVGAAGVVCLVPANWRMRLTMVTGAATIVLFSAPFLAANLQAFKRDRNVTVEEMAQSATLRPMLATVAWEMFKDRPILGYGFGQYTNFKRPYHFVANTDMPLREALPYMQHNVFLSYATETGLVGLALLVVMLSLMAGSAWRVWCRRDGEPWQRGLGLVTLVTLGAYVANGSFHDVSIIPMVGSLLFWLAGMTVRVELGLNSPACVGAASLPAPITASTPSLLVLGPASAGWEIRGVGGLAGCDVPR